MDAIRECVQGEGAAEENLIMEGAEVELVAELDFGIFAKLENLQLADLVAKSLSRPSDVAVGFGLDADFVFAGVLVKKVDHLLTRPVFVVNAGIRDETYGPEHVRRQEAVIAIRVLVKTHLFAETLGVQSPTFDKGGEEFVLPEGRQVRHLLSNSSLHVMARDTFVIGSGFDVE